VTGTVEAVLELARSRPPTLGAGRLVCVDGPAGSGKTTLAAAIAARAPGTRVVHMDDLFAGWDGLPEVDRQLAGLLRPLATGAPGSYRRYDWLAGRFAETVTVEPVPLLVVEGVGSGSRVVADLVTALVWVHAPYEVRLRRGLERDGDAFAPHWEAWALAEEEHFAREGTRERADLVVDGAVDESGGGPGDQGA
jgi:uridine kinase